MATEPAPTRMTTTTLLVLRTLLEDPSTPMYGLQICQAAGLPSGTIHPILARYERLGWLESEWEQVDPREAGRPARRFYHLNPDGAQKARAVIATAASRRSAVARLFPALGFLDGIA